MPDMIPRVKLQRLVDRFRACQGLVFSFGRCLAVGLLGLMILTTVGCGGSEPDAPAPPPLGLQPVAPAADPAAVAEPAADPPPAEKPAPEVVMEESVEVEPIPPEEEQPPEKRERPEDFAEWTLEEFRDAHTENDRRFPLALQYIAENKVGDADIAQLLSELLVYRAPEIEPPPENANELQLKAYEQKKASQLNRARSDQSRHAQKIIETLGLVGTDKAIGTLSQAIAGTLDTGLDSRRGAEAALKSLIEIRNDGVQEFMYTAITAPAELRTADDGSFPPEEIQKLVLRQLPTHASHELRTKLGQYAAQAGPQDPASQDLWRTLSEPRADNLQAQLLLYLSPQLEEQKSDQLHKLFVEHSRRALDDLLGVPEDAQSQRSGRSRSGFGFGGSSKKQEYEDDADLTYEVVRVLWTLQFLASVSNEMQEVVDLNQGMPTIELIGALPVEVIRQGIAGYLDEHWDEVAGQNVSQLPMKLADALQDPGLLLVIKDVPRRRDPEVRTERRNGPDSTNRRPRTRPAPRANDPRQMREESQYIWMDTTEAMVKALNARMMAAATAVDVPPEDEQPAEGVAVADEQPTADEQPGAGEDEAGPDAATEATTANGLPPDFGLPYELNEGAKVVASHHVRWPDEVQDRIKDQHLAPLEVHYVRIECEDVITKVASHYQGQLERSQTRFLENEGRWLDLQQSLDTGWNRSTDVMIQRVAEDDTNSSDEEQSRRRNAAEPLIVEILVVATEKPQPPEEDDAEEAAAPAADGS